MRRQFPAHVQVKAAHGVRDLNALLAVHELGVLRVGTSRTSEMLDECRRRLGLPAIIAPR
jgi:deoxyribose-phosphate aldolase